MDAKIVYLLEKMDSHMFQVIGESGQVIDEVDIISAEGIAYRLRKLNVRVVWVDRGPSPERKYVRELISKFSSCCARSSGVTSVRVGV